MIVAALITAILTTEGGGHAETLRSVEPREKFSVVDVQSRVQRRPRPPRTPRTQAAPPLSAYVGKTPLEAVDGVTFLNHPLVRAAIDRSGAPNEASALARSRDTVTSPIMEVQGRILSRGSAPASGGDVNWALLISLDGQRAAVCYSTGVVPDVSGADWYIDGEKAFTRYEMCPGDADDLIGFGNWPIEVIPG